MEQYDIIVIGSGLGGLAAATLLSRKGHRTLLVEGKKRVGGRFSTVEHEGFLLPTGAIVIHAEGWLVKLVQEMGLDMTSFRSVSQLFYRIYGRDYEIPYAGRLKTLLGLFDKLGRERAEKKGYIFKEIGKNSILSGIKDAMSDIEKTKIMTFREWLLQYTENELAHELFDQLCVSLLMGHSWELPASEFFNFIARTGGMKEFYIASKGNLKIGNDLARIVEDNGNVWLNCLARKIVIKKGKAVSVIIEKDGQLQKISCRAVISDTGPVMTTMLVGSVNFDDKYLRKMRMMLRPSPSIMLLVASDRPLCFDGKPGLLTVMGGRRIAGVVPVSNICPEVAPPGSHLLFAAGEPVSSFLPMDRKYEYQQCLQDLKEMFPDFEKHGRVLKMIPCDVNSEWPEGRTWSGFGMPVETTIPNLFNVGDACLRSGIMGTSGAVETGYRAAEMINNSMNLKWQ